MRELAPLPPSGPNASPLPGRPQAEGGFDDLLSAPISSPQAPVSTRTAPRQEPGLDHPAPGAEPSSELAAGQGGLPRPERETSASRARGRRPDAHSQEGEEESLEKRRRPKSLPPGQGVPLHPHFAQGLHPSRAAQAAGAAQLKGAAAGGSLGSTAKVMAPSHEASRKPSAPEQGESSAHRSAPASPQPAQATPSTSSVEPAAPPPLPAPIALAALDLPSLHLAILPNVARLSVSTEEGDVRVQVKVKDSVASLRVEGAGAPAFQRAPEELRVLLAQAGLSLGSFEMGSGGGQQHDGREHVQPFEPELSAGFVTQQTPELSGTEGEQAHSRHVRVKA